jgi:hypothetical protein
MASVTKAPGTAADDAAIGTQAWANVDNIKVNDSNYAIATAPTGPVKYSHYLKATNFGFNIPSDATITGVEVLLRKFSNLGSFVYDENIRLIVGGTIKPTNKADTVGPWEIAELDGTYYGGESDLWNESLTPSDINNSGFGFAVSADMGDSYGNGSEALVYYVAITVYYTEAPPSINAYVNVGGVWKQLGAIGDHKVNVGGVWKPLAAIYVNIGGVWKSVS